VNFSARARGEKKPQNTFWEKSMSMSMSMSKKLPKKMGLL
jgi:hypothetical protein